VQLSKHAAAASSHAGARVAERIVVFNKRDLVPEWGITVDLLLAYLNICHSSLISASAGAALSKCYGRKIS
jgi:hypothetical protein